MSFVRRYVREVRRCFKSRTPPLQHSSERTKWRRFTERLFFASIAHRNVIEREQCFRRAVQPYSDYEQKTNTIFVHVPKAAGNSICNAVYGIAHGLGHDKAIWYRTVDPVRFDQSLKFTFVRNPFDRLVSAFEYLRANPLGWYDRQFCSQYLSHHASFDQFVLSLQDPIVWGQLSKWTHFTPQFEFICDQNQQVIVDFVGRFESLAHDLIILAKRLDRQPPKLEKRNSVKRDPYENYYTAQTRRIVADRYRTDFDLLGYSSSSRQSA